MSYKQCELPGCEKTFFLDGVGGQAFSRGPYGEKVFFCTLEHMRAHEDQQRHGQQLELDLAR